MLDFYKPHYQVRATPIPVTTLTREEEGLLSTQLCPSLPDCDPLISLFQLGSRKHQGGWERVSLVVTPSHLLVARSTPLLPSTSSKPYRDFFQWLFQPVGQELELLQSVALGDIEQLVCVSSPPSSPHNPLLPPQSIYEQWPARLGLTVAGRALTLRLQTEVGGFRYFRYSS